MAGGIIVDKYEKRDGHIYYVVKGEGSEKIPTTIFFLDYYDELSHYASWDGTFFIRNAAKTSSGKEGDPTVHSGWAMYTWDPKKSQTGTTINPGWVKIAEQESLDLDETKFVSLVHFNKVIYGDGAEDTGLVGRIVACETKVGECVRVVEGFEARIIDLEKYKHWHDNKTDVLDQFIFKNGRLEFRGVPLGGNTLIYDNIRNGKLVWIDPTNPSTAVEVKNSMEIAQRIKVSGMDWVGMKVTVVEANGDLSTYQFIENPSVRGNRRLVTCVEQIRSNRTYESENIESGTITENITEEEAKQKFADKDNWRVYYYEMSTVPVFLYTITNSSRGAVTYVGTLPDCDLTYVDRGLWCPLTNTDKMISGHLYSAIEDSTVESGARWSDVTFGDPGALQDVNGAQFVVGCHALLEPEMPYKKNVLFWKEPENIAGRFAFGYTKLVRSMGGIPETVNDGIVVATFTTHDNLNNMFVDVCPFSTEPVYYRLFTFSNAGVQLKAMDAVTPKYLEWSTIIAMEGTYAFAHSFSFCDYMTLPCHPKYGFVNTIVKEVKENYLVLETTEPLTGVTEALLTDYTKYVTTTDEVPITGKQYKVFGENGYEDWSGETFPVDTTVYELDQKYPDGILDSFEITGNKVVFTLKH